MLRRGVGEVVARSARSGERTHRADRPVPLAIASGAGAESRQQIGWVIVGGMTVGTLLTLFILPAVYTCLGQRYDAAKQSQTQHPVSLYTLARNAQLVQRRLNLAITGQAPTAPVSWARHETMVAVFPNEWSSCLLIANKTAS